MAEPKDYRGFRITAIHAIVGIGDDDEEGVVASPSPDGMMPLIASDGVRLELLKVLAQQIADTTGRNFKIARFTHREEIGEIKSRRSKLILDIALNGIARGVLIWVVFGGAGYFIGRFFPLWPR